MPLGTRYFTLLSYREGEDFPAEVEKPSKVEYDKTVYFMGGFCVTVTITNDECYNGDLKYNKGIWR